RDKLVTGVQTCALPIFVVVVVTFSVLVQGSLVPTVARLLRLPMRTVHPEPWSLGVRLREEPEGVHRMTISSGAPASGRRIDELRSEERRVGKEWSARRG